MNRVVHFEIHAEDPTRASAFYSGIFGWEIKKWGEQEYWMLMTGKDEGTEVMKGKWGGIDGGMVIRKGEAPQDGAPVNAFVCTMDVASIDEMIGKIEAAGGKVVVPKYAIPTVGYVVYCKDTEGNIFGMMQSDESAK